MRDSSSGPLYASHVKRSLFGSSLFTYNRVLGSPILQLWLSITSRDQHIMWAFTCPICSVLRFLPNLSHSPSFLFLLVLSPLLYPPPYVHYCSHPPLYILNSISLLTVHFCLNSPVPHPQPFYASPFISTSPSSHSSLLPFLSCHPLPIPPLCLHPLSPPLPPLPLPPSLFILSHFPLSYLYALHTCFYVEQLRTSIIPYVDQRESESNDRHKYRTKFSSFRLDLSLFSWRRGPGRESCRPMPLNLPKLWILTDKGHLGTVMQGTFLSFL